MDTYYVVIGHLKIKLTKNDPILDRISLYGHRSTHCDPYLDRLGAIQSLDRLPAVCPTDPFTWELEQLLTDNSFFRALPVSEDLEHSSS